MAKTTEPKGSRVQDELYFNTMFEALERMRQKNREKLERLRIEVGDEKFEQIEKLLTGSNKKKRFISVVQSN